MKVGKRAVLDAILAHARAAAPEECCGLLIGRDGEIVHAVPARNIADRPASRFVVDPADHIRWRREARISGLSVMGFYHSHPDSPPQPSPRDLAEFSYPDHLYAIVSLKPEPAEVRMFRFEDGNFRSLPFVTVP